MKDGKGNFLRKLELDSPTMKLIQSYRKLKVYIDRDATPDVDENPKPRVRRRK